MGGQATFARQDLWKSDMSKYDNVVIFGVEQMMEQLEERLEKERRRGAQSLPAGFNFLHGNLLMKLVVEWTLFGDIKGDVCQLYNCSHTKPIFPPVKHVLHPTFNKC